MEKTIVIIGGSFNPPTIAHLVLANITKTMVNADLVLLVPARLSYMTEWKKYQDSDILSDDIRIQALTTLENDWMKIDRCELDGTVSGTSYDTLVYIKDKYHTQQVYFAIGSDKLEEIPRWYNSEQLLKDNKFVVIKRNNDDIEGILETNPFLKSYKASFIICTESDEETQDISSTKVRNEIEKGNYDKVKEMVPDTVYQVLTNNSRIGS